MVSLTLASTIQRNKGRVFEWCQLLAGYSFIQAVAQGLGVFAAILVVRTLSKEDYACFVIVNSIGPAMTLLSDNGVTGSLSAIGGRFWQDDEKMGSLVNTATILRRRLALFSALLVTPAMIWMLLRNQAHALTIVWLVALTLVGVYFQFNTGVLTAVVNLRQQVGRMQALVFAGVLPRLALIAGFAALSVLNAPLAAGAGVVAFAAQFLLLEYWVKRQIAWRAAPQEEYRTEILALVKKQAPLTIYFCLQSQISIWLISVFGNVHHVAEVGALGRIGMIFGVLASTVSALVVPRFARCQEPSRLLFLYAIIILGFASLVLAGTILAWLFPGSLLWLLGAQYAHLSDLVWLAVLASGTTSFSGVLYSLNTNKGWIPPAALMIPLEIIGQVMLCLIFDLSTPRGVLAIGVLGPLVPSVITVVVGWRKLVASRS